MAAIALTGLALPSITAWFSNSHTPHFCHSGLPRQCIFHRESFNHNRNRKFICWKKGNGRPLHVIQAIKLVDTYDASFQLEPEAEKNLISLLSSEVFCNQVAQQAGKGVSSTYEFTGDMFKPVPWSVTTKHGMPQEFEKYLDCDKYAIINVPPNFMFKSKIFSPSRLCAVFRRVSNSLITDC